MLLPENLLNSHQVETDSSPTGASLSVTMSVCFEPYSDPEPATAEIQQYCNEVKNQVEKKTNHKYVEFKAVIYRYTQVSRIVAGINYLVKIQVNECDYIHVHLFLQLFCNEAGIVVEGVQEHHKKDDPLERF